ncbi:MAG: hypothetical protein QXU93_11760 [Thermoproteus sp.]
MIAEERRKERLDCDIADFDKFSALPVDVQQKVLEVLRCPYMDASTRLLLLRLERMGVLKCL